MKKLLVVLMLLANDTSDTTLVDLYAKKTKLQMEMQVVRERINTLEKTVTPNKLKELSRYGGIKGTVDYFEQYLKGKCAIRNGYLYMQLTNVSDKPITNVCPEPGAKVGKIIPYPRLEPGKSVQYKWRVPMQITKAYPGWKANIGDREEYCVPGFYKNLEREEKRKDGDF